MSTPFSIDIFLETVEMIVMFIEDGYVMLIQDHDPKGRIHRMGDVIHLDRDSYTTNTSVSQTQDDDSRSAEDSSELAVVLGWGESRDEAVAMSREYIRRVAKWDGAGDDFNMTVFGFDLSDSQVLQ